MPGPDYIEALARGLDVLRAFGPAYRTMSLSDVAAATGLARPTARRILLTLAELGYVRGTTAEYELTPRVLELGMSYISSSDIWTVTRPRLQELAAATGESCSIAQLDGSDIVYVSRVAMPKLVTLSVTIGTRFPAFATSLGKVLLAALPPDELAAALETPSRSGVVPSWHPSPKEIAATLREVRDQGWALTDQQLAPAIRSVAAPITGADGAVVAAVNVNAHAAETSLEALTGEMLPKLLGIAAQLSSDWALWQARPVAQLTERE
ncbi:IclR family transcriptional regulator C-terminal domain-containing protein [Gryllotalpicola daejeonensis]|uniref:IclR family transcriptional regulator C-terminal domain-containing protein n=1 Tax=Gryllotalpicola daejeonensis TaxID=993087 RepID=A0ABP7ZHY5_9MICO